MGRSGLFTIRICILRAKELEDKINELGEENIAAFIAEPIQGAGGIIPLIHMA